MKKTRVGIFGYGNLGRGAEAALTHTADMELCAVFTRRDPSTVHLLTDTPVISAQKAEEYADRLDVMILCGGSATDLPTQTPQLARLFNVVDSFDTHANIPQHFARVDAVARAGKKIGIISVGWDPGLFSLNRLYDSAVLPGGTAYTFWGRGVSQGHSDAIRRIPGVLDARQYTVPVEDALQRVRRGETPALTARQKHTRECYVVAAPDADKEEITRQIVTMPHYFDEYDTTVHFISAEELHANHSALPHGGSVLYTGKTGLQQENTHVMEYKLNLQSNPQFTAGVLVAFARAAVRLQREGQCGCKTVLDIPPAYLSPLSAEELRASLL